MKPTYVRYPHILSVTLIAVCQIFLNVCVPFLNCAKTDKNV